MTTPNTPDENPAPASGDDGGKLLPCPFCGSQVRLEYRGTDKNLVVFLCPPDSSCVGMWLGTYGHKDHLRSAITAWNTRTERHQNG